MRPFEQVSGTWRFGSLKYGLRYGLNKWQVMSGFFNRKQDFWARTPYGIFHCVDIASAWQFSPSWEPKVRELVSQLRDSLFLDVGANIGFYSILAAKNGNGVIAVEANRRAFNCLKDNLLTNHSEVEAYHNAAWFTNERVKIATRGYSDISQVNENGTEVDGVKLDSILLGRLPHLIKMDIEGAEPEALAGLSKTLSLADDTRIIFEALDGSALDRCRIILSNFTIVQLDGTNFLAS